MTLATLRRLETRGGAPINGSFFVMGDYPFWFLSPPYPSVLAWYVIVTGHVISCLDAWNTHFLPTLLKTETVKSNNVRSVFSHVLFWTSQYITGKCNVCHICHLVRSLHLKFNWSLQIDASKTLHWTFYPTTLSSPSCMKESDPSSSTFYLSVMHPSHGCWKITLS